MNPTPTAYVALVALFATLGCSSSSPSSAAGEHQVASSLPPGTLPGDAGTPSDGGAPAVHGWRSSPVTTPQGDCIDTVALGARGDTFWFSCMLADRTPELIRFDGTAFVVDHVGQVGSYIYSSFADTGSELFFAESLGSVLRFDGTTWSTMPDNLSLDGRLLFASPYLWSFDIYANIAFDPKDGSRPVVWPQADLDFGMPTVVGPRVYGLHDVGTGSELRSVTIADLEKDPPQAPFALDAIATVEHATGPGFVLMPSTNEVIAVCATPLTCKEHTGNVLHGTSGSWKMIPSTSSTDELWDIQGTRVDDLYAVRYPAAAHSDYWLEHFDGATWSRVAGVPPMQLTPKLVVGDAGRLFILESQEDSPTTLHLYVP